MSYPFLHFLSHAGIGNYHVHALARALPHGEFLAGHLLRALPTRLHADPSWRILDTFDWFSPYYQWKHDEAEVKRWFEELGFEEVRRLPERTMVSVRGARPSRGALWTPEPSEERRQGAPGPLPGWVPGRQPFRDLSLLALLLREIGHGYGAVARYVLSEAGRKLASRPSAP